MVKKILLFLKSLSNRLVLSTKRFPETILFAVATVITLIFLNHLDYVDSNPREQLTRIAMVLALGIPLSLCIKAILERKPSLKLSIKIILYLGAIAGLASFYLFLLEDINNTSVARYVSWTISLYLTFSIIPYFFKKENYEFYVITLFIRFVTTYLYSFILFLGLAAIIFTINTLFSVNMTHRIYFDIWLIVVGIFAPAFFLADIPKYGQELNKNEYSKILRVLLLYIVMPLIVVYSVILYVYFIKIIVTAQWPQGILSNLVLWFSIVSTIVIFFIYPLKNLNQWVKSFISFFPKLLLPLLIMMFVAMGMRINAYGVTENRYFVLVAGLWVTGSMIYHSFSKQTRNIVITTSLALIVLLAVTGPLSAYTVSKYSQNSRFQKILMANNMITAEKTIVPSEELSKEDKKEISSILLYFENRHKLNELKYIPDEFKISQTKDVFGFELENEHWGNSDKYFGHNIEDGGMFINIKDFDYFADYTTYRYNAKKDYDENFYISYSEKNMNIEIVENGEVVYTKNISDIATIVHKNNIGKEMVEVNDMSYTDTTPKLDVLYIFNNINGFENTSDETIIHPPAFNVFIKIK